MKFDQPYILFFLWGLIPLAGLLVYGIFRHKKILSQYMDVAMSAHILPGFTYGPKWVKASLVVLAMGFAVVALAGPMAGYHWEKTTQKGVDLMIALDCSRSMLAQDISPARLTRAKREIIDLTRLMHSDRAGLVAFSGAAMLQCPLTLDYAAFGIFLDALNPDYLPVGGTDLTAALETCYNGFDPKSDTGKAIILITDGEDTAGDADALNKTVEKLAKENIRIFAIGVGDPAGAPIPEKGGGFKKDTAGNIILSRVDEAMLKKITAMTQGRYVRSVAGDMDLEQIYSKDILGTMERRELTDGRKKVWEKRFQWALFPCVLLLLIELVYPDRPRRNGLASRFLISLAALGLLLVCGIFAPDPARAGLLSSPVKEGMKAWDNKEYSQAKKYFIDAQLENPDDLRLYYNIGAAAYAAGEYDLALSNFAQAASSKDKELRHNALYNLANTRYRTGELEKAVDDYSKLLKEFPEDVQAKENLDFVKKKIEEQKKQQENQNQDSQKNQNDKDGKKQKDSQNKNQQDKNQQDSKGQDQDKNQQNGQDQQNKEGQNNQSPDQNQQNKAPQNQDPQNKGQQDQPKDKNQDHNSGQAGQQDQPPPPQPASENGSGDKDPDQKTSAANQARQAAGQTADKSDPESKMLENRLNRLEDKPGMALIPQSGVRNNEKDW